MSPIKIHQPSPVLHLPRHERAAASRRNPLRPPRPEPKPPAPTGRKTRDTRGDAPLPDKAPRYPNF